MSEFLDSNYAWVQHSQNFSVNTMGKHFASNLISQGSIERGYLLKNIKKSVFEMFNNTHMEELLLY